MKGVEMQAEIQASFQQVQSSQIYYETVGTGSPLVLLHGLSGSTRWWRKNIPVLSQHYRLYIIDLIGFGRSHGQRFSLQKAAAILLEWADGIGLDRFDIIGHSMGGYIAADMSLQAPGRIPRLVLVDAAAVPVRLNYLTGAVGLLHSLRYMPADFLPVLFSDAYKAGAATMWKAIQEIMRADLSGRLAQLHASVLILWGQQDPLLRVSVADRLRRQLPEAQFKLIPRAGHNPMWDQPVIFNREVLRFLNEEAPA